MADEKKKDPLFVVQWCPNCDVASRCEVISKYAIECETCHSSFCLAAIVAHTQLEGYEPSK